ncbi:hypothetical protein HDU87_005178 [Geranomyces variabilis]|uniref:Uncharacterized protein n=1 Tax=Geranomyces variabilis TaxID=109894 RepID=A0AAD5XLY7_9FUNG|nr:hypothetical protein HDU87_005178 [Geranomyces variabilis]
MTLANYVARSASRPKLCPKPIDLGNGLVLRRATREDRDTVAELVSDVLGDQGADAAPVRAGFALFARNYFDHIEGAPHPTADWESWTVVMDGDKLASCMVSVPQIWTYGDGDDFTSTGGSPRVALTVMRAELVGTDPAYRAKGLVRRQFAVHHAWAEELESPMQIIMGIRSYYRQFGYAYAMGLSGGRSGTLASLPPASAAVGYALRRATKHDVAFLTDTQRHSASRHALAYDWGREEWNYALEGTFQPYHYWIVEREGKPVAFAKTDSRWWAEGGASENDRGNSPEVRRIEIAKGQAWTAVAPAVFRLLAELAAAELHDQIRVKENEEHTGIITEGVPMQPVADPLAILPASWSYKLNSGPTHPVYISCAAYLPNSTQGYAYYTRFSVSLLLPVITPVLTHRIARSPFAFHTGILTILARDRNDPGHVLVFDSGNVTYQVGDAPKDVRFKDRAGRKEDAVLFPATTFYSIVTGYHSVGQVLEMFPDAGVKVWTTSQLTLTGGRIVASRYTTHTKHSTMPTPPATSRFPIGAEG